MTNLEALKRACAKLGLVFNEGQTHHRWYSRWVSDYHGEDAAYKNGIDPKEFGHCAHAISLPNNPNAYEIGVVPSKTEPGSYQLVLDFWHNGYGMVDAVGGKDMWKLFSHYQQEVVQEATQDLVAQGWTYDQQQQENGDIVITLRS